MKDKLLVCEDCGDEFILTKKEQDYYKRNGLEEPRRCVDCIRASEQREEDNMNERYGRR
jgi:hypothetical protein